MPRGRKRQTFNHLPLKNLVIMGRPRQDNRLLGSSRMTSLKCTELGPRASLESP